MGKAFTHGQMERYTKENGAVDSRKAKASGRVSTATRILESGASQKLPAMACICGRMATGSKVNGKIALNMDKVQIYSPTETASQAHMSWASQKVQANTSGRILASTLESSRMVSSTERESGRSDLTIKPVTCTRVLIKTIKRTAWECSRGSRATSIGDATRMTSGTAMARCTGKMAPVIRVSGIKAFKMASVRWNFQTVALKKETSKIIHSRALQTEHLRCVILRPRRSF